MSENLEAINKNEGMEITLEVESTFRKRKKKLEKHKDSLKVSKYCKIQSILTNNSFKKVIWYKKYS